MFFHVLYLTLTDTFRSPLQCTDLKKDLKNVDTVTMGQPQKLTENYCVIFFIFFIFTLMSGLLSYKVHWKCQILYIIWWCMYLGSDSDTAEINHSYSVAFFIVGMLCMTTEDHRERRAKCGSTILKNSLRFFFHPWWLKFLLWEKLQLLRFNITLIYNSLCHMVK